MRVFARGFARAGLAGVVLLGLAGCGGASPPRAASAGPKPTTRPTAVQVALARWRLPVPLSRAVAFPSGNGLLIAGGLLANDTSTAGLLRVDPATGTVRPAGMLVAAVHDAGGIRLRGHDYLFGGGTATSTATVQEIRGAASQVVGALPQPRSDLVATAIGGTAYVLGGYDGVSALGNVLATTDGRTFTVVATLQVPVRYPAVAAIGHQVWLFGGRTATGYTAAIQRIDVRTGASAVVGQLPTPLAHASAVVLGGQVYLAGGRSAAGTSSQLLVVDRTHATVRVAGTLPGPIADSAAVVVGRTAYLIGGETPQLTSSVITITLG